MRESPEETRGREVPDRSLMQRMDALDRANVVRTFRADLKRDLRGRRADISNLLSNPPEQIDTMKVFDLLLAVPKIGRTKVTKMLNTCRMSPSKTVGGMSDRQRSELIVLLRHY